MGRGGKKSKSKKSKTKTKAQKMAVANKAKYGGTAKAAAANKAANKAKAKAKHTASQAAKKTSPSKGGSISKGTTGIGPVKSGATYSKAVSKATNAPTKKTSGVGPVASGKQYASMLKASPPKLKDGTKVASAFSAGSGLFGDDIDVGDGVFRTKDQIIKMRDNPQNFNLEPGSRLFKQIQEAGKGLVTAPGGDKIAATGDMSGLGISPTTTTPSYFSIKSPETFGAPSQADVDAAAGITAGGLNIGGSGFTPDKPSGGSTSRAIRDMTSEQLADRYDASLNPNSFKGLSDGQTFGVGPVASGDAYARGLNTDNKNVENRLRQVRNLGSTLTLGLIPSVRKLTDKEIADRRIKNAAFREANLVGRKRGSSGGARLPVAPLTPEEILEEAAVAQTVPDYQQALPEQTGVDPNRLMQIQQDAYLRAFNPSYNPMFRFFGRRGGSRRASFRKAFRRD